MVEMLERQYQEGAVGEDTDGASPDIQRTDLEAARASELSSDSEQTMGAPSDVTQTVSSEQILDALPEQPQLPRQAPEEPGGALHDALQAAATEQQLQPIQGSSEALAEDVSEAELDTTARTAEPEAALAQQAQQLPEGVQQAAEALQQLLEPFQQPDDAPEQLLEASQHPSAALEQQDKAFEELAEASQESAEAAEQLNSAAEASDEVLQELQQASEQLAEASEEASDPPKPAQAQPELGILLSKYPADDAGGSASSATTATGLKEHLGSLFDSIRSREEQPVKVGAFFDSLKTADQQPVKADASAMGLSARRASLPQRKPAARSRDGWSSLPGETCRRTNSLPNSKCRRVTEKVRPADLHGMPAAQQRNITTPLQRSIWASMQLSRHRGRSYEQCMHSVSHLTSFSFALRCSKVASDITG